jgi:hypothetical protein
VKLLAEGKIYDLNIYIDDNIEEFDSEVHYCTAFFYHAVLRHLTITLLGVHILH